MPLGKQFRHEFKYTITPHEYFVLRSRLFPFMQSDPNAKSASGYHIRSLYFDDVYNSSLFEKGDGIYKREKFRIRIYDKSHEHIKLERKNKFGNSINKEQTALSIKEYYYIINGRINFLAKSDDPLKKLLYSRMRTNLLKPVVITDYYRDALIFPVSDVRVTFDQKISTVSGSLDIFDFDSHITIPSEFYDKVVLEVKYNNILPDIIKDRLCIKSPVEAVSKYMLCRLALEKYNLRGV